ncbi:MAG: molybdopterin oxidoreductase [Rhodospirillaceae bacterium]|nr:MAG: molybdopterin oxidoreductase [Rhodospirillaceae bacterium]
MVRQRFLAWAKTSFPRDAKTGAPDPKYMNRGRDTWATVSWKEAFALEAAATVDIARTYPGESGMQRLLWHKGTILW